MGIVIDMEERRKMLRDHKERRRTTARNNNEIVQCIVKMKESIARINQQYDQLRRQEEPSVS